MPKRPRIQPRFVIELARILQQPERDVLWALVEAQFFFHINRAQGDVTAEDAMNRVARKHDDMRTRVPVRLSRLTCDIREAIWYVDGPPLTTFHQRRYPAALNLPVVVLSLEGEFIVIEGTTRVNAWRLVATAPPPPGKEAHDVALEAIVITPRIAGAG